jgi:hypothetical protein
MTPPKLPESYELHRGSLSVADYLQISNKSANLTPLNEAQASAALDGS